MQAEVRPSLASVRPSLASARPSLASAALMHSFSFVQKKKKKRLPRPKPDETVTTCWTHTPLLTRIPRPGSGRPASASRPPRSLQMTLHYSQVRMDAPTPVRDALTPARSRPATAGHLRCYELARGAGTTMFLDATTNEPLGGSVELRQRPSTARPDLGGSINAIVLKRSDSRRTPVVSRDYQLSYLELVEEADSELAKMLTAERCAAREPAVWCLAGARNSGSVTDPLPPGQGIRPLGARVQEGGFRACGVAPAAPA